MPSTESTRKYASSEETVTEATALLGSAAAQDLATATSEAAIVEVYAHDDPKRPLDYTQITLLCYARLVEPIAFFSIFPFVNDMILRTGGIPEEDCGFYSGIIESLFSITQMLLMIPWEKASDKIGRKPVLIFCLIGLSLATSMFGLSKAIWQMILFRCLAGVFAGSIVYVFFDSYSLMNSAADQDPISTVRAMISENSTSRTQARAFSLFGFAGNLGIFVGPLIGGSLTDPSKQYPRVFGNSQFLHDNPYALACFVTGFFGLTAAIVCLFFVKETLPPRTTSSHGDDPAAEGISTWTLLNAPGVRTTLSIYSLVMLLALSYTAVVPVFQFTSPALGGFGFSPAEISTFLAIAGIGQSLWTLLVFPPLQRKVGTKNVLKLCSYAWPIFFAGNPLSVVLLRNGMDIKVLYGFLGFMMLFASGVAMAFIGVQLALNDVSPDHRTLGTLNALALTLTSAVRAFAPALFTSIYATGVRLQILDGLLIWVVLIAIALAFTVAVKWLPEDKVINEDAE